MFVWRYGLLLVLLTFGALLIFQRVAAQTAQFPITNYGAKCNGLDDDAPAIEAAVNAAAAAGGGIVLWPQTTSDKPCVIKSEVYMSRKHKITFKGVGDGRNGGPMSETIVNTSPILPDSHPFKLKNMPYMKPAFNMTESNDILVTGLRFTGPRVWYKSGNDPIHDGTIFNPIRGQRTRVEKSSFVGVGYAVQSSGAWDMVISDIHCIDWGRTCIGANKNTTIENTLMQQTGKDWTGNDSGKPAHDRWSEYAVYSYACNCNTSDGDNDSLRAEYNFVFRNNIVQGARAGIHVNGGQQGYRPKNFTITNNTFIDNRDSVIGSDFGGGGRWENVLIAQNKFLADKRYSLYIYKGEHMTIRDNLIDRTAASDQGAISGGIKFISHFDDLDLGHITVKNNEFNGNGIRYWSGITVYEEGGYRLTLLPNKLYDWTIENNKILNIGETRYGAGIYFSKSDHNRIRKIAMNCNTVTFTSAAGSSTLSAGLRMGAEEGAGLSSYIEELTFSNNTITGNGNANLYGIYTQNAARVKSGAITNNAFNNFAENKKIQATMDTGVTVTHGTPSSACAPGITLGLSIGANLEAPPPPPTPTPTPTPPPSVPKADVQVTKSVDRATAKTGERLVYTLSVKNTGDAPAKPVQVVDVLDPNLTAITASNSGQIADKTVIWNLASLAVNQEIVLTLEVQIADTVTPPGGDPPPEPEGDLTLSDFYLTQPSARSFSVSWTTNYPSTTDLRYWYASKSVGGVDCTQVPANALEIVLDSALLTSHQKTNVFSLNANSVYCFQAKSRSSEHGEAYSTNVERVETQ